MIYHSFYKVKRAGERACLFFLMALLPFINACRDLEDEAAGEDMVPLTFYIQAADQQTRAYIGDIESESNAEKAINTVQVWLFDNGACVGYTAEIANNKVTMNIPQSVISKGSVDVYIIANGASGGITGLTATSTIAELTAATLSGTNFTPASPTTAVPSGGLPMSRIVKNCPINTTGVTPTLGIITVTRAVSKIRFAFAKTKDHQGEVLGIKINGNMIAGSEYIFPVEPSDANEADYTAPYIGDLHANILSNSYVSDAMMLGSEDGTSVLVPTTSIQEVYNQNDDTLDPTIYTWANWSDANSTLSNQEKAVQYNRLMNTYVTNKVYLRETDKQLTGTIYYRLSSTGAPKSVDFRMIQTSDVQDFARNHVWIVYGYFLGNKFNLIIQTIPWEDAYVSIDYTETVTWKDEGSPLWTPALNSSNSSEEQIGATTYTVVHTDAGDTPKLTFNIDSPQGWEWIAVLEPLTDGAGDFISFANGSSAATGSVGQPATLNFKIATTATSEVHRARLKLYVRTTSHDQSLEVQAVKYIISRSN